MTQKLFSVSKSEAYSVNGQILTSPVFFSSYELEQVNIEAQPILSEVGFRPECYLSQVAEENCLSEATATFSREATSIEEISATSQASSNISLLGVTDPYLHIGLCILGIVAVGSVSLVSIIALVLGRDISLAAVLGPNASVKLKARNPDES
jgi:hypothetical protein